MYFSIDLFSFLIDSIIDFKNILICNLFHDDLIYSKTKNFYRKIIHHMERILRKLVYYLNVLTIL